MNHLPARFKRSMREVYPNAEVWSGPYRRSDRQWKWIDRGMAVLLVILILLVVMKVL